MVLILTSFRSFSPLLTEALSVITGIQQDPRACCGIPKVAISSVTMESDGILMNKTLWLGDLHFVVGCWKQSQL